MILTTTVLLLAIFVGTRLKGMSLGMMGGLGLAVFVFVFHIFPTRPPVDVLLIITTVVTAVGTLEAAGGMRCLTCWAEALIRRYPHSITYISPLVVYLFTLLGGTGHTVYSLLPIIADVSRDVGVRPERPLSVSVIAAQQAVLASPISAPIAIVVGILAPEGIALWDILAVCIPATFLGVMLATLVMNNVGAELHTVPGCAPPSPGTTHAALSSPTEPMVPAHAWRSVVIFMLGIAVVMLPGAFKSLRPAREVSGTIQYMPMTDAIEIVMLSTAALITALCPVDPRAVVRGKVFAAGIQAVIAIMGISWLGDTFVSAHKAMLIDCVQCYILQSPWQFSVVLFGASIILVSQSATIQTFLPLGLTLGLPATALLAALPAVNGLFVVPNYPTVLSAVSLDRTGTTRIGKWVLNHSFMLPGCIATGTAVVVAHLLVWWLF